MNKRKKKTMHKQSHLWMKYILTKIWQDDNRDNSGLILDVGSLDINGSYKKLCQELGWTYTGLDIVEGPNVDIIALNHYKFPVNNNTYDVVISGSTLEHVENPFRWVQELTRVLVPGGMLAIITHWKFKVHRHPKDCWRILPDGMRVLFDNAMDLENYIIEIVNSTDIIGVAFKKNIIKPA